VVVVVVVVVVVWDSLGEAGGRGTVDRRSQPNAITPTHPTHHQHSAHRP